MFSYLKKYSALFLSLAVLLAGVNCFCWAQVAAQTCHVPAEMPDCCCGEAGEVTDDTSDLPPMHLPPAPKLPGPEICTDVRFSLPHLSGPLPVRQAETTRIASSRATPARYIINASFLI